MIVGVFTVADNFFHLGINRIKFVEIALVVGGVAVANLNSGHGTDELFFSFVFGKFSVSAAGDLRRN